MGEVWLIVAGVVVLTGIIGALRVAARTGGKLAIDFALLLGSALLCYMIGASKTGGHLPGLAGMLMSLLMLIAAGGLLLGAGVRWLFDGIARSAPKRPPVGSWDIWLLLVLSTLAVGFSIAE
ncbi:hypothetical protein F8A10_14170 [Paracoccus kondratievae]|uniref:Uncharacterized protein n=2 Tax=Paracoccaceae TaxID=31989 RepID=A0AAD3NXP9_9RHOB|nr:hypothetical protein [Paracoccus sp. J56]QFQ89448.1 hypothetical protein F8A10_14170 [Paracoccus kondratievae]GLK63822.1 hypothetical protein GCM10017635_12930 [Paracoccus kondratievae]SMG44964.1 hypothetical protein SAMN02746000_02718 [Paracoccus sp. J56]